MNPVDMTLRDYLAAAAMQGILAQPEISDKYVDEEGNDISDEEGASGTWHPHTIGFAEDAYAIADLMLKARK